MKPELLAPAGNWDCARAAVANGANAVYFGLQQFNARQRADNFTDDQLPALMQFLHAHNVRGYAAFNVLIFTHELAIAERQLIALDAAGVDPRVARIMDLKAPGSGECEKNLWQNLEHLTANDELKFVLASEADYDWAKKVLSERKLDALCQVLFSPVAGQVEPAQLAGWILRDRLPVRFQLQLHKILWGAERGK